MENNVYICVNGGFLRSDASTLFSAHRILHYGDVVIENMHAYATAIQFAGFHMQRLKKNMKLLFMDIPSYMKKDVIQDLVTKLLNKNRIFGGALIRLCVFRGNGDQLFPENHEVCFIIESIKLNTDHYALNENGLKIDVCEDIIKPRSVLSPLYNSFSLHCLYASVLGREKGLDDVILLNEQGKICESTRSNIFLVSGTFIFTPGIIQGCVPGVMRQVVMDLAAREGYRINDQSSLTVSALDDAEEIFLTNAVEGIRWVMAFRQRRYYNKVAKLLVAKLNEVAFGKR